MRFELLVFCVSFCSLNQGAKKEAAEDQTGLAKLKAELARVASGEQVVVDAVLATFNRVLRTLAEFRNASWPECKEKPFTNCLKYCLMTKHTVSQSSVGSKVLKLFEPFVQKIDDAKMLLLPLKRYAAKADEKHLPEIAKNGLPIQDRGMVHDGLSRNENHPSLTPTNVV